MGMSLWLILSVSCLHLVDEIHAGESTAAVVEVLTPPGLDALEDENILRVLTSRNKTSDTSDNFTFVELVNNLSNHTGIETNTDPGRGIWSYERINVFDNHTNPYYGEFHQQIDREVHNLLQIVPAYDPGHGPVTPQCKRHSEIYREELSKFTLWALKMYDATAKIPSGLLNGNVNQLGDFDECVSVEGSEDIQGQYCLAYLQVDVDPIRADLKHIHRLLHSHYAFKSNVTDPGHRVPRFSTINWAVCAPSSCTTNDVEISLRYALAKYTEQTGIKIGVHVNEEMCQVKRKNPVPRSTIIVSFIFASILALTIVAAYYDHYKIPANEILLCFSLKRNFLKLISLERAEGDIPTLHGVRALNALMLVLAHKSLALFFNPYINRTNMTESLGKPWTVIGRAASLYTDPFIMLSGLLTTYSLVGRLRRTGRLDVKNEYLSRLIRLVPMLGGLILFCTFIMPYIGSGPQWNLVVTQHANICKKTWWRNFLFIHNYFGFENMCLTHTHHLGIDTQLFAFSPLMVLLLYKKPKAGSVILIGAAILSTILRFYVTYMKRLNNYVFFGTSIRQLFDTANLSYILPTHRLTVYIIGVCVGYLLRTLPKGYKFDKTFYYAGWILCTIMFAGAFFGPAQMGSIDYKYNPIHAAAYNAFAPIGWCSLFAWVALMHHTENTNGWVSRFLSWRGFLITTRLSYAVYLTQFPVFFFNVGQTRSAEHYEFFRMSFNINEYLWIILTSAALTLIFDSPSQNIKNYLLKTSTPKAIKSSKAE